MPCLSLAFLLLYALVNEKATALLYRATGRGHPRVRGVPSPHRRALSKRPEGILFSDPIFLEKEVHTS